MVHMQLFIHLQVSRPQAAPPQHPSFWCAPCRPAMWGWASAPKGQYLQGQGWGQGHSVTWPVGPSGGPIGPIFQGHQVQWTTFRLQPSSDLEKSAAWARSKEQRNRSGRNAGLLLGTCKMRPRSEQLCSGKQAEPRFDPAAWSRRSRRIFVSHPPSRFSTKRSVFTGSRLRSRSLCDLTRGAIWWPHRTHLSRSPSTVDYLQASTQQWPWKECSLGPEQRAAEQER